MGNLEYSDSHKFFASLGLVLIGLAAFIPWIFLREPFDLLVTQGTFNQLLPEAQNLIKYRISNIAIAISMIPWVSLVLFFAGLIFFVIGVRNWLSKQKMIDAVDKRKFDTVINSEKISDEDQKEKVESDQDEESSLTSQHDSQDKSSKIQSAPGLGDILSVEVDVIRQIKMMAPREYEVLANRRIGGREFDVILVSKSGKRPDITVEIKYVRKKASKDLFYRFRDRVVATTADYQLATQRRAQGSLVLIAESEDISKHIVNNWIRSIADQDKQPIKIPLLMLTRNDINQIDFGKFIDGDARFLGSAIPFSQ